MILQLDRTGGRLGLIVAREILVAARSHVSFVILHHDAVAERGHDRGLFNFENDGWRSIESFSKKAIYSISEDISGRKCPIALISPNVDDRSELMALLGKSAIRDRFVIRLY